MISLEPPKPWPYAAVILSGGASRRMGVPKGGMILPDGRNMIERMRDTLASFCRQVVIAGSPHGMAGHQTIEDLRPDSGPLAAIEAALASDISPQYLIVPCDLPLLPAGLLARLLVGDDAGTLNFARIKGTHTALKSGTLAAETLYEALAGGVEGGTDLTSYADDFNKSWLHDELHNPPIR